VRAGNFSLRHRVQTGSGGPLRLPSSGYLGSYPGDKWPDSETVRSPPSNTEVRKACNYTSTPPYVFMTWCLIRGTTLSLPHVPCSTLTSVSQLSGAMSLFASFMMQAEHVIYSLSHVWCNN